MAETLDQQQTTDGGNLARFYSTRSLAQTFTCGITGSLTKISLLENSASYDQYAPATIRILGVTGEDNHPDATNILYEVELETFGTNGQWNDYDLSDAPPDLIEGNIYAIALYTTDSSLGNPDNGVSFSDSNLYASGQLWENRGSGWVVMTVSGTPYPNSDFAFKTYITPPDSNIKSINGVAISSVKSKDGVLKANIKSINGVE